MCVLDTTGESSICETGHGRVEQIMVLKLQKNGQFLDELVKTEDTQSHGVVSRTSSNDRYKRYSIRRIVIIVGTIFSNFVRDNLIK